VVANYVLNTDSDYGYRTLWYNLPSVRPVASINAFPSSHKRQIPQYSADYYTAFDVGGAFQLTFTQPETVGLIPASVFEGGQMAYAVPADYADATLTRNVDLTGVTSATLQFRTWYDLEENWDYAYVMVSTDAGATWDSVPATTTRDSNPYNRAYGVGFTGQSFGWVEETVSLDAYVGREILLRFEVITDAASLRHSIAVDAIRLDAVGYIDGFENGFGAWEARGWIVTDNRLPQSAWVQVIHLQRDTVQQIDRYRADSPSQTWTITPALDADMLVIVVSPFAPQTMLGADYTLAWVNGD
jgi:immune inhibitor A